MRRVVFVKRFVSGAKIVERVSNYQFWADKAVDAA